MQHEPTHHADVADTHTTQRATEWRHGTRRCERDRITKPISVERSERTLNERLQARGCGELRVRARIGNWCPGRNGMTRWRGTSATGFRAMGLNELAAGLERKVPSGRTGNVFWLERDSSWKKPTNANGKSGWGVSVEIGRNGNGNANKIKSWNELKKLYGRMCRKVKLENTSNVFVNVIPT